MPTEPKDFKSKLVSWSLLLPFPPDWFLFSIFVLPLKTMMEMQQATSYTRESKSQTTKLSFLVFLGHPDFKSIPYIQHALAVPLTHSDIQRYYTIHLRNSRPIDIIPHRIRLRETYFTLPFPNWLSSHLLTWVYLISGKIKHPKTWFHLIWLTCSKIWTLNKIYLLKLLKKNSQNETKTNPHYCLSSKWL